MSQDTENLILEHLRIIRSDVAAVDRKVDQLRADMNSRFAVISQRLDHMEKRSEASQSILTATLGSLLSDNEDVKARLAALENA